MLGRTNDALAVKYWHVCHSRGYQLQKKKNSRYASYDSFKLEIPTYFLIIGYILHSSSKDSIWSDLFNLISILLNNLQIFLSKKGIIYNQSCMEFMSQQLNIWKQFLQKRIHCGLTNSTRYFMVTKRLKYLEV